MTSLKDEVANRTANWAALADLLKFLEENKNRFDSKMLRETLPVIRNLYTSRTQESDNRYSFTEKVASVNDLLNTLFDSAKLNLIYYIPAERILLSMVAESIFGLMSNDVSIAECIKDFGAHFESARRKINQLSIPFLDSKYNYSDKSNFITFSDGAKVKLEQASSGLQSIIPLLLVVESNTIDESVTKKCFVLEEPELNLYPTVQKELIEFIVERINKSKDKLIITTHSPYVLTSLDNLIQASNAAKVNPEQKEKVVEIVPEEKWVDFDRVACYYFEEGTCRSTLDTENQTIGASNIDDVSEELGKTFDQLLELKYAHVS
ncbi:MAG: AAA family ATPase [Bacteroidota bacterium]